jgi:protein required for attachment to host cells
MIINRQVWIVVADGGRANVYKNVGEIGEIKLALVRSSNQHSEHTHALGGLRKQLPANVAKLVVSEIGKDYTHMAINELQKTLMNIH